MIKQLISDYSRKIENINYESGMIIKIVHKDEEIGCIRRKAIGERSEWMAYVFCDANHPLIIENNYIDVLLGDYDITFNGIIHLDNQNKHVLGFDCFYPEDINNYKDISFVTKKLIRLHNYMKFFMN